MSFPCLLTAYYVLGGACGIYTTLERAYKALMVFVVARECLTANFHILVQTRWYVYHSYHTYNGY